MSKSSYTLSDVDCRVLMNSTHASALYCLRTCNYHLRHANNVHTCARQCSALSKYVVIARGCIHVRAAPSTHS